MLHELAEAPGLWHEQLLEPVTIELPSDADVSASERARRR